MTDKRPVLHMAMEVKARELEGRTLLALEAASRRFRVVLGPTPQVRMGLKRHLPQGIYFDKSLTRGKEKKIDKTLKNGHLLVSQDEESGLLDFSYDRFIAIRSTCETVDMAGAIFCWGEHDHASWVSHYPDAARKIHVTGSPRVDYWRPDHAAYFRERTDFLEKKFGRFVLVSSNFVTVNRYMTDAQRVRQGKVNGSIRNAGDEKAMRQLFEDNRKMFGFFVSLVNHLAEHHPEINFVVRPHPAENPSGWRNSIARKPNLHVILEGGISPWVKAALAVLHNGCTTGLEAYVLGTPAIAYAPFETPLNREIPNKLSINCTTREAVADALCRIYGGEAVTGHRSMENDEAVRRRLANMNGPTAAGRIVDVLETLDIPRSGPVTAGFAGWGLRARRLLKLSKPNPKFPGLTLREVTGIRDNLSNVSPEYRECRVRNLYGDVFLVER